MLDADPVRRVTNGSSDAATRLAKPRQGHVRPEGAPLNFEAQAGAGEFDVVMQEFELGVVPHPRPDDPRSRPVGKGAQRGDLEEDRVVAAGGRPERGAEAIDERLVDFAEKADGCVESIRIDPPFARSGGAQRRGQRCEVAANVRGRVDGDEAAHAGSWPPSPRADKVAGLAGARALRGTPTRGELSRMRLTAGVLRATALLLAAACGPAPAPLLPPPYTGNVTIIAHRGASGHEPEHTIASYDKAIALGAHYIEQDLQRTADGMLVVMHDETLDRTIRGPECRGRVSAITWKALRRCDAGSWFGERYPDKARLNLRDLHPLALTELFARYRDTVRYYIETKKPEEARGMERQLLDALRAASLGEEAAREWRVVIQSFSDASLRTVKAMEPQWPLVQLLEKLPAGRDVGALMDSVSAYADGVGPNRLDVDSAFVAAAHERCLVVHPYTVDIEEDMRKLARAGVDGMFTDYPDRLRVVLGGLGPTRAGFPARCPRRPR